MKRTTIMADEELLYKIGRIAQRKGVSKATIIREALIEYVAEESAEEQLANPLLGLIGIAEIEGEEPPEIDPRFVDLSDGKDEEFLRESYNEKYERVVAEFMARQAAKKENGSDS
ncbi:MAG: ribbon-helix-helix domain-containing protein [Anaerolineae bacterium]|nr:ribbon-helix-helix domain-containing protein [Anaerolineae bacterium]MCO5192848.1 ribbon-helix-helix domain-containing protein [Anaerolineae bacterium]MCO5207794.1 ribbon-helix-helix domain-containing protein [Anaerolineae bacterium]